ncbi:MAG: hypothetical protein WAM72_30055, partial [Xanthobacteraceae bacterium]
FQAGHFLFGVEGDFDWATFDHPTLPFPTLGSVSQHWIGTAAGRFGWADDLWLVYGKFGGGWVHSTAEVNAFGQTWNGSSTKDGWLVGAGVAAYYNAINPTGAPNGSCAPNSHSCFQRSSGAGRPHQVSHLANLRRHERHATSLDVVHQHIFDFACDHQSA